MQWNKNYLLKKIRLNKIIYSISTKIFLVSLIFSICIISLVFIIISIILLHLESNLLFDIIFPTKNLYVIENIISLIFWMVVLLLIISYFTIYKLLTPLKKILKGIHEISEENLQFQFQSKKKDEFGDIMKAFDKMTKNITNLLNTKKQLLLDLSHELKTPITRAKLSLENLNSNKHIKAISEDLIEMNHIISFILDTEKFNNEKLSLKLEKISLKKTMQEIINYQKKKKILINYKNQLPEKKFLFYKPHLKIIVNNLIQNAERYSNSSIFVSNKIEKNHFILKIKDKGIGIATKEIPKITGPFYKIDKSRNKKTSSYGLGLNICQRIINFHQGVLEIKSNLGKGTVVKVVLPLKNSNEL